MLYDIVSLAICAILTGIAFYLVYRVNLLTTQLSNLTIRFIELDKKIDNIDESTGADIFRLKADLDKFKAEYGDAAIEEMRQAANREKAWADGINEIMSYGARFQGRGDST